jgi:hypothetical protein
LRVNELNNSRESGDVSIAPKPEIAGGDAALWEDCRGFKDDQASATLNTATQVNEVPIGGEAVPRRVLAHGRDTDAVGKADRTELQRRKKRMAHALMDAGERGGIQRKALRVFSEIV